MLLSKAVLKDWDADLRMGRSKIQLNKFQVTLPFTYDDVPIIDSLDVELKELQDEWHKIPDLYKLNPEKPGMRYLKTRTRQF